MECLHAYLMKRGCENKVQKAQHGSNEIGSSGTLGKPALREGAAAVICLYLFEIIPHFFDYYKILHFCHFIFIVQKPNS